MLTQSPPACWVERDGKLPSQKPHLSPRRLLLPIGHIWAPRVLAGRLAQQPITIEPDTAAAGLTTAQRDRGTCCGASRGSSYHCQVRQAGTDVTQLYGQHTGGFLPPGTIPRSRKGVFLPHFTRCIFAWLSSFLNPLRPHE